MLSIGTGYVPERLSLLRPKSPGFWTRVKDAWDWNLCGERQWKEIINSISTESRHRYHRINLPLSGKEPRIDDTSMIESLMHQTQSMLLTTQAISTFHFSWLASLFFAEIQRDGVQEEHSSFRCAATIFCRQNLSRSGIKGLYEKLRSMQAYFLVNGNPIPCITWTRPAFFRRDIEFQVEDLTQPLFVALGMHNSGERWPLSGLPRAVSDLIEEQGLNAPFGRADYESMSGPVLVPQKRALRCI
jgi:hypothetical protein